MMISTTANSSSHGQTGLIALNCLPAQGEWEQERGA
jgi:hypothetical protein